MIQASITTADWVTAVSTGVAAVGTVGTLIAVLAQLRREREARHQLERSVAEHARRAQAERVSAWLGARDPASLGDPGLNSERRQRIELLNASDEPVYRAAVYLVYIQGAGPRTGKDVERHGRQVEGGGPPLGFRRLLSVIPPGRHYTTVAGDWGIMSGRPGAEIAFTDRAGVHWLRASDGSLTEIEQGATYFYDIDAPHDWEVPDVA